MDPGKHQLYWILQGQLRHWELGTTPDSAGERPTREYCSQTNHELANNGAEKQTGLPLGCSFD